MNKSGEEFGVERLKELLFSTRHENFDNVGNILIAQLESWLGNNHFEDDISMLALEIANDEV